MSIEARTGELNVTDMVESHPVLEAYVDAGRTLGYPTPQGLQRRVSGRFRDLPSHAERWA